ncbi:unnamed protein product [Schistocephalus solidus]|uniref:Uncharacterized protein n=1 Tax=Schistocephalus solidus TaxID=70667 RepID=A0A3P7C5Q8_SCHSO|nr:unnamed protein product [Schistocephalus solidus]
MVDTVWLFHSRKKTNCALLAWKPVNDRMAYARMDGHFTNISAAYVYAPTSAAEQRDKETYSHLQDEVSSLSSLCPVVRPPSEGEVFHAIQRLHNNKAPAEYGIHKEIYNACVDTLVPWLYELVNSPVAAYNWYPTLTCGSSKLGSTQRQHFGQPSRPAA